MRITLVTILLLSTPAWATNPSESVEVPEQVLVESVMEAIMTYHDGSPECGNYCTSDRRDRSLFPDWSGVSISEEDARYMAEAMVWTSDQYGVPLDEIMATAFQESTFRYMAIGSGTECGLYQQTTRYFRWEAYDEDHPVESREPVNHVSVEVGEDLVSVQVGEGYPGHSYYEDTGEIGCAYLLDPYNAGWQMALKYHYYVERFGEHEWSRFYNGGPNQHGYAARHRSYRQRFQSYLESEREEYISSLREQEGGEMVRAPTDQRDDPSGS